MPREAKLQEKNGDNTIIKVKSAQVTGKKTKNFNSEK